MSAESPPPAVTLVDDATVSLSCAASPCDRSSPIKITYNHLPGNTYDTVVVTPLEGDVSDRLSIEYTGGKTDGQVMANVIPGAPRYPNNQPLVARVFEGNLSGPQIAVSAPLTLAGTDAPSLIVRSPTFLQNDPIYVDYADFPGFVLDMVAIVPQGGGDGEPFPYKYVDPQVQGTLTFDGLVRDDWLVARGYKNGISPFIVESAPFRLSNSKDASLVVTCSQPAQPGQPAPPSGSCNNAPRTTQVNAQFANMPGYFYDVIVIAPENAPLETHLAALNYTEGQVQGQTTFTGLPSGVSLEARAFKDFSANYTSILVAHSAPFTLTGGPPAISITCDPPLPALCRRSSTVTATYSGLWGYVYDSIAFYKEGSAPGNGYTPLQYTLGVVDGKMTFTDLPSGRLVARGFKNQDFSTRSPESNVIEIFPDIGRPPTITIGCAPYCRQGQDIVVSYSSLQSFFYSSIYAYTYPDNAIQSSTLYYQEGASSGTFNMGTLPIGNYVVASDEDPNGVAYGRSLPFSVAPLVPVCGDGIRDPATEQCDDGNPLAGDSCSATCSVTSIDVAPRPMTSGTPPLPGRTLGEGRHPMASQDKSFAVTFEQAEPTPSLTFAEFTSVGVPMGAPIAIGDGTSVLSTSNPVIAALPGNRYVAAWTDLTAGTMGDGDEQGIALRLIDPAAAPNAVLHANTHTDFSQFDPDILYTGSDLVVAWVDESNPSTKRDVRYRLFAPDLTPRGSESTLAGTTDSEADIALAGFAGSWAAAWRVAAGEGEIIRVHTESADFSVGPFLPGPAGVKPALSAVDDTHLLLVFTQGVDVGNNGVANGTKLSAAVLDVATPGNVTPIDIGMSLAMAIGANRPSLAHVGGSVYVGWEGTAAMGAPVGQHAWMKELTWSGTALDWSKQEAMIPRDMSHARGDQDHLVLCETTLPVEGGVLAGWNDLGMNFATSKGEVIIELEPVPMLRH